MKPFFISRWLCAVCFLMFALPVLADRDHDRALDAVKAGEIMPLGQVLQQVEKNCSCKILKVELEQKEGTWVYKLKLLHDDGTLSRLYLNARDGTVLEKEPRHGHHGHRRGHRDQGSWEND